MDWIKGDYILIKVEDMDGHCPFGEEIFRANTLYMGFSMKMGFGVENVFFAWGNEYDGFKRVNTYPRESMLYDFCQFSSCEGVYFLRPFASYVRLVLFNGKPSAYEISPFMKNLTDKGSTKSDMRFCGEYINDIVKHVLKKKESVKIYTDDEFHERIKY